MSFKLAMPTVDFGQTAIENILIDEFMPAAPSNYLKVYLMGYRLACTGDDSFSNETIAKRLMIHVNDVVAAWQYWQAQGVVSCQACAVKHSEHQFDVVFHALREKYLASGKTPPTIKKNDALTPASKLMAALSNPHIKKMFEDIEFYARRMLTAQEKNRVLSFLEDYHMEIDVVVMAFYITYEERAIMRNQLNYVEGIIKNWYRDGIFDTQALHQSGHQEITHYQLSRTVCRALGINQRQIPTALHNAVSNWCDDKRYDEDFIVYVVQEATRRTNNPNLNYLISQFEAIEKGGDCTIEGAKQYFANKNSGASKTKQKNSPLKRSQFQNFSQKKQADLAVVIKKKNSRQNGG